MKKILFVLAALVLALALVACGAETVDTTEPVTEAPETEHVHAYAEEIVPATCAVPGKIITKCECGDVQSEEATPLADHIASVLDCEKDTTCTVCGIVLAEKTGHVFSVRETIVEPTCTTTGKEKGACITCGKIVESELPTKAHSIDESAGWTLTDGKYNSKCTSCNSAVALSGQDVLLNLTYEEDMAAEMAKYPAFEANLDAFNVVDDIDGDKAHLAKAGKIVYLGIADRAALSKTGYYEISFDYAQTAKTGTKEASILTLMPGQYAGTKVGSNKYGWFFKYNTPLEKMELILAGDDATKLNDTNSFTVESNKIYKINILCAADGSANYVSVDCKCIGKASMNKVVVDFTDAKNEKSVSIRFGDAAVPGPVFDNFKIQTIK